MKNLKSKLTKSLLSYHPEVINYDEFKHSAIFLPLVNINDRWSLLFEKRTKQIAQGGEICFPGGRVEKSETKNPILTAIRETTEELGVTPSQIKIIDRLPRLITPDGKLIDAYIGTLEIDSLASLHLNSSEVAKVFAIPLEDLVCSKMHKYVIKSENFSASSPEDEMENLLPVEKLGLPDRYIGSWGEKEYNVYYFEYDKEKIWGLTARYAKYISDLMRK